MKWMVILLMATACCMAQNAKVIQLSPEDAAQAKALADEQKALDEKTAAFREAVKQKYLVTTERKEAGDCYAGVFMTNATSGFLVLGDGTINWSSKPEPYYRRGWRCGEYQYSDDFNFIVPVPAPPYTSSPLCTTFTN